MPPQKLIIDTDPGVDDSIAILLALCSPEVDVIGLTTIFSNTDLKQTTRNALKVLETAGRPDIPVAAGAAAPLVRPFHRRASVVHGEDGLGNTFLPPPDGHPLDVSAAEFITQAVAAQPGEITLVAIGPLTNLALALKLDPHLPTLVKRVVIMGGAAFTPGNISPVAEANIYHDPESASLVFSAEWPLTMVGLDVTMKTVMSRAYVAELAQAHNPLTDLIARITPFYFNFYREVYGLDGAFTHDPSALAYVIDPTLFRAEHLPVFVETAGRCVGQTVPDRRKQWPESSEINVCVDVDSARLLALFKERLTKNDLLETL